MWFSRVEDADKVKDTVQVSNPLKLHNNAGNFRSPMQMNRAAQRVSQAQGTANEAGVLITLSGARRTNATQNAVSLSNIDMNLFAAD